MGASELLRLNAGLSVHLFYNEYLQAHTALSLCIASRISPSTSRGMSLHHSTASVTATCA